MREPGGGGFGEGPTTTDNIINTAVYYATDTKDYSIDALGEMSGTYGSLKAKGPGDPKSKKEVMAATFVLAGEYAEILPVVGAIVAAGVGTVIGMWIKETFMSPPEYKPQTYSKGGTKNVWPDGQYPKPDPNKIDWRRGDQELADEITGPKAPKGPTSPNNLIKKWFRDKRPK
jgi:hypothetical protein